MLNCKKSFLKLLGVGFLSVFLISWPWAFLWAGNHEGGVGDGAGGVGGGKGGITIPNPLWTDKFDELIKGIAGWVYTIGIPIVVIMILWSGLLFVTSGGNEEKVTKAKKSFLWAIVGLSIIVLSASLVAIIQNFFKTGG